MNKFSPLGIATLALAVMSLSLAPAWAQRKNSPTQQPVADSKSADPASLPDQELGRRFAVKAEDLPPPRTGPVVSNRPLTLPYEGQTLRVPEGFTATLFASGLQHPRRLLVLPNGDVLVAEQKVGYLTLLRDADGDGKADWIQRHAEGLNGPYGLAWRDDHVLVADQDGIWKVPHRVGALRPGRGAVEQKAADVPPEQRTATPRVVGEEMISKKGVFGIVQGHANRHIAVDPKTGALFVGVGSSGNIGVEPEVKATIQRFEPDGSGQTTYASGMRNPTALAFEPTTGNLYAVVQERDGLGDRLVPDYLTRVQKGAFYGWPIRISGSTRSRALPICSPTRLTLRSRPTFCSRRIPQPWISCFTMAHSFRRNGAAAPSSRSKAPGTGPSPPATRWCGCRSRTVALRAVTRIS